MSVQLNEPAADLPDFAAEFEKIKHDLRDPDAGLAMYLDRSLPIDDQAKAALLIDQRSFSRQFILPVVRPFARLSIILVQIFKLFVPNAFTSSKLLHKLIRWGLEYWVSPQANFLILRHFHIGSEVVGFVGSNTGLKFEGLTPLRPERIKDVEAEIFLKHDLNLYNFIILLNQQLRAAGKTLEPPAEISYRAVTDGPFPIRGLPRRWTNFLDLASAIELYTPLYQLFLTDSDFWRASNSLQLDETMGVYVATVLGDATHLSLVNNHHPLVPLSTMRAGFRLVLHGLASECLHALLVHHKRGAATGEKLAPGLRAPWKLRV